MSQFDFIIIAPLIISLIITLFFYYYFSLKFIIKTIEILKFKTKFLKLKNPLNRVNKTKNIIFFEKK